MKLVQILSYTWNLCNINPTVNEPIDGDGGFSPCQFGATSQTWPAYMLQQHQHTPTQTPTQPNNASPPLTSLEAWRLTTINGRTNNAQLHQTHLVKGISLLYNQQTLTGLEQYSTKFSYDVMKTIYFLAMSRGKARGRINHPTTPGRNHPSLKIIHH